MKFIFIKYILSYEGWMLEYRRYIFHGVYFTEITQSDLHFLCMCVI